MTALVSVMNKHAVAIAADSAVTVTSPYGHKVINSANKVFTLSKYHPVGIMFCGNSNFMCTPIEVIVKLYRQQLGTKSFPYISDYLQDLLEFIKKKHYFCSMEMQERTIAENIDMFFSIMNNIAKEKAQKSKRKIVYEFIAVLNDLLFDKVENCISFPNFSLEEFVSETSSLFTQCFVKNSNVFKDNRPLKTLFQKAFAKFVVRNNSNIPNETQIVVVGYGEDEIFPSLKSVNLYWGFKDYFRYVDYIESAITEVNSASITRFGQTDIINTLINGINDSLKKSIQQIFTNFTFQLKKLMMDKVDTKFSKDTINSAINVEQLTSIFKTALDKEIRQNFIDPLINSLDILDKEDMAELVESLISITHLNRRITMSEEGVGGPIDVAIISKSDGFIWKKRKHYFKPELNQSFFDNYYRN